jgi:hypothetical protein
LATPTNTTDGGAAQSPPLTMTNNHPNQPKRLAISLTSP